MILVVVFVVCMVLWLVSLFAEVPAPWGRAGGVCAWIAVLCLFLLMRGVHV